MSPEQRKMQIAGSLRELVLAYSRAMDRLETTLAILCRELELDESEFIHGESSLGSKMVSAAQDTRYPQIDRRLLSAIWRGRSCFLGNTLPFRLLERLARRPDIFVPCEQLLDDVWHGPRSMAAIRSVVKELRQRLRAAGMDDLAGAIDGSVSGHYGLMIARSF